MKNGLTASSLKQKLWETLALVKSKKINATTANAVATQSREIMRIVRTEIAVSAMSGLPPSVDVMAFNNQKAPTYKSLKHESGSSTP